jgi:hypothetical protein
MKSAVGLPRHRSLMVKRDFEKLALQVRLDTKQKASQQALLVPWHRLEERVSAYVDWHIFVLWVRSIGEFEEQLPEIVRAALGARCPGFLDDEIRQREERPREQRSLWHSLEEWIAAHPFVDTKTEGWFDAVMYYAYKDLRTEKAWSLWERSKDAWNRNRPSRWPTLEEWTAQVIATNRLVQTGTEKARAVEALGKVEPERLRRTVFELLEWRAFALWVACISQPNRVIDRVALSELRGRCPSFLAGSCAEPVWQESSFFRLVRLGEAEWCALARTEKWYAALRYHLIHHPRYHRFVHYNQRCHDEWFRVRPTSYPSFAEWLCAADEYSAAPQT